VLNKVMTLKPLILFSINQNFELYNCKVDSLITGMHNFFECFEESEQLLGSKFIVYLETSGG
jgi:hypothetical protein